jgi:hypothetical protein
MIYIHLILTIIGFIISMKLIFDEVLGHLEHLMLLCSLIAHGFIIYIFYLT